MIASKYGNEQLVSLLLKNGAAIDAITIDGVTALLLADHFGHAGVVKKLLAAGSDPRILITHECSFKLQDPQCDTKSEAYELFEKALIRAGRKKKYERFHV
jgi:ankyrin repeat protein